MVSKLIVKLLILKEIVLINIFLILERSLFDARLSWFICLKCLFSAFLGKEEVLKAYF